MSAPVTPADMGMTLFNLVDRCKRDDHLVDSLVSVDAATAGRIETTAKFLMLLDGHQEEIRTLVSGKRRRPA